MASAANRIGFPPTPLPERAGERCLPVEAGIRDLKGGVRSTVLLKRKGRHRKGAHPNPMQWRILVKCIWQFEIYSYSVVVVKATRVTGILGLRVSGLDWDWKQVWKI